MNDFIDVWNDFLGLSMPMHHRCMVEFLCNVLCGDTRRGLMMAFRHSGKSSVVGAFVAYVLSVRPESKILILSAEQNLATRMVTHIKNIIESHPGCQHLVPRVKKEWSSDRITVARRPGMREPSVVCQGLHGNITGLRADLIICDDVEVPNTCNTAIKREQMRERLKELDFILSPDGAMIYIGTPHAKDTIYDVG